jgi:signal transduction histidine kinase
MAASPKAETKFRGIPFLIVGTTLAILGAIIALITLNLRGTLREHIINQDSKVLSAVSILQQRQSDSGLVDVGLGDSFEQFNLALEISRVKGVLAVRLFDTNGVNTYTVPATVSESKLAMEDLEQARLLRTVSHYHPKAEMSDLFGGDKRSAGSGTIPLLDIVLPIPSRDGGKFAGAAQFIMDGSSIAAQFKALDKYLWKNAAFSFAGGGLLIALGLGWAFLRLQNSNKLLLERTRELLKANHELALSAKTSALGAVTAHLIHGLKNPLFGLQSFMATGPEAQTDWKMAAATTQRMQELISEAVRILQEEDAPQAYEITVTEIRDLLAQKLKTISAEAGVRLEFGECCEVSLPNREGNLVMLILTNLLQNAIQATPRGKSVMVCCTRNKQGLRWQVSDKAGGLPKHVFERLFTPCASSKAGGSGLGLAISKQLANHMGGHLELVATSSVGTTFALSVPEKSKAK